MAFVRSKLFLVLSILCLQYAINVSGLKCFVCPMAPDSDKCGDVKTCGDAGSTGSMPAGAEYSCLKAKTKSDGKTVSQSACITKSTADSICETLKKGGATECAVCDKDECNGGNQQFAGRLTLGMTGAIISIMGIYWSRALSITSLQ